MSAMERLRELLDERGVEWAEYGGGYTEFWVRTVVDGERHYIDVKHYTVQPNVMDNLIVTNLTPEQAIAATLGAGTCKVEGSIDYGEFGCWQYDLSCGCRIIWPDSEPPMFCPECGRKVVDDG